MLIRLLIILLLASGVFGGAYYAVHKLYLEPEHRLKADKSLPPPTPPPDPSLEEFVRCEEIRRTESPEIARAGFERFIKQFPESKKRDAALDAIGEINSAEYFSAKPGSGNVVVVKPGDSLSRIAANTKMPIELLVHLNKLQRDMLQPGQKLLAPGSDFRILLKQRQRRVVLMNGEKFFRQYPAISWPGANKANPIFLPKQSGKVTDKLSQGEKGAAIKVTDLAYSSGNHVITVGLAGQSMQIFTHIPEGTPGARPEGSGIALAPAHAAEIAILIPKGAPVTME